MTDRSEKLQTLLFLFADVEMSDRLARDAGAADKVADPGNVVDRGIRYILNFR